jgi:hypothetical protein
MAGTATIDSGAPVVTLRTAPTVPFDGAIAAARTCYSPRVIATSEVTPGQRDLIGALTFDAGHHTVYQHAHFEFGLENISRQFVWSFLHSYPFYNSEQSSQRYVKLREPRAFVPPIAGEARDVYEQAVLKAWDRYAELSALLKDDAFGISRSCATSVRRPTRAAEADREGRREAGDRDRALRHPDRRLHVDGPHRVGHRAAPPAAHDAHGDAPYETRVVISEMVRLVKEWDPFFFEKIGAGVIEPGDVTEAAFPRPRSGGDCYAAEFDARLNGRWSRLRDASPDAEEIVAESVRSVFGLTAGEMSDDEALDRVMNPARNRYRLDILNVSYHSPLMRALHHATYVFEKRLSHTADSQDQRHRMVPASRPLLTFADTERPDYITPRLIAPTRAPTRCIRSRWRKRGRRRTGCWRSACRSSSRSTSCPTPRRCASSSRGRSGAAAQVDAAHLFQRAGRDLSRLDGRARAGAGRAPAYRPSHRAAVRHPQRPHLAALHRGHALLRRAGVEGFSRPPVRRL